MEKFGTLKINFCCNEKIPDLELLVHKGEWDGVNIILKSSNGKVICIFSFNDLIIEYED